MLYLFGPMKDLMQSFNAIISKLQEVYTMPLKEKQIAAENQGMEVHICSDPKPDIGIRLHGKVLYWERVQVSRIMRWCDPWSANCVDVLPLLIMGLAHEAKFWSFSYQN